jgi:hypothetical protein
MTPPFHPHVAFFRAPSNSFVQFGSQWRRMTTEDEARSHTGYDHDTREPSVGVYIVRRQNGLLRIGFDIWKLDVNLRPTVLECLENRWRQQTANFSKSLLRSVNHRVHFSKSFAQFEIAPEQIEEWKQTLEDMLSNPASYEALERRTTTDV